MSLRLGGSFFSPGVANWLVPFTVKVPPFFLKHERNLEQSSTVENEGVKRYERARVNEKVRVRAETTLFSLFLIFFFTTMSQSIRTNSAGSIDCLKSG